MEPFMPNAFDPYREALVIEQETVWPDDLSAAPLGDAERRRIEYRLHADPAGAAELEYVRLHAGFIRKITVTAADLK
jgi:hypothetical protein